MFDPTTVLTLTAAALAGLTLVTMAGLSGWRGWLDLQKAQLAAPAADHDRPTAGSRIELADLRERVRKLEAIAAGVDL